MIPPKADGRLQVQIPAPADDRPSWTKVGVITAIGFVIGIAWPRIAGVRLGPSVPGDAASAVVVASGAPSEGLAAPSSSAAVATAAPAVVAAPALPAASPSPAPTASAVAPTVSVGHGIVFACKTAEGESLKGADCGTLSGLDTLVMPRLRKLAECADAAGASGKLHLNAHVDFGRGGLSIDLGRGNAMPSSEALLACAKTDTAGLNVAGVSHENAKYSVAYTVGFDSGGAAPSAEAPSVPAASPAPAARATSESDGSAQVVWEVAIVRDAPKTGKVLARLQRGTTVHLGSVKDGWYPVKYGDGFASDGWVYRGAIGR